MSSSEKRRGAHGAAGGHTHRTTTHTTRHAHNSSAIGTTSTSSSSGTASNLPALPPRAAMVNANATGTDETHEANSSGGGATLAPDRKEKDKDKDKETAGGAAVGTSPRIKEKQRDRERESASLAAQVKQKDERIAHLEKEMDIMEREFQHQLDRLSQNESETATFWEAKHSTLHQQFLRTDTELRLLRSEVDVREAEREELRQGWEVLRRELKERDDEIRGLRGQVRGLKEFVSTSTRADGQTSDEVFGDGMARLGNGLQNWVITHFRKAKLDLSQADEDSITELGQLVPMYEDLAKTAKIHLLQSLVSRILVEMVFNAYFVGLTKEQTGLFQQMEELLSTFCGGQEEPVNQWRASTLTLLRKEGPQIATEDTDSVAEDVVVRVNRLLGNLTEATSSEARDAALRVLVNNSVELARLLVVQKAVLEVHMPEILPHQRTVFEAATMEDIGGEDEDALADREICCVVFPGLIKHGDENGGQMQFRNVISKAKVLCGPED